MCVVPSFLFYNFSEKSSKDWKIERIRYRWGGAAAPPHTPPRKRVLKVLFFAKEVFNAPGPAEYKVEFLQGHFLFLPLPRQKILDTPLFRAP
jgi:hypothetical protein